MSKSQSHLNLSEEDRKRAQSLLEETTELADFLEEIGSAFSEGTLLRLRDLAGGTWETMLADSREAEMNLHHSNAQFRYVALWLVANHFHQAGNHVAAFMRMAKTDPDLTVRILAVQSLGSVDGRGNAQVGPFLAQMVQENSEPDCLRLAAYRSLVALRNLTLSWKPRVFQLRFPEDVDWSFVASFPHD